MAVIEAPRNPTLLNEVVSCSSSAVFCLKGPMYPNNRALGFKRNAGSGIWDLTPHHLGTWTCKARHTDMGPNPKPLNP